jgi:hypothetical protein
MRTLSPKEDIMQILYYQKKRPTLKQNAFTSIKKPQLITNLMVNKQYFPTKSLTPSKTTELNYPLHTHSPYHTSPSHHTSFRSVLFQQPYSAAQTETGTNTLLLKYCTYSNLNTLNNECAYPRCYKIQVTYS